MLLTDKHMMKGQQEFGMEEDGGGAVHFHLSCSKF